MESYLNQMIDKAIWVAKQLFARDKVTGSSGNLSFLFEQRVYITGGGSCFGRLEPSDFAVLDLEGNVLSERKPSKEWPFHLMMYKSKASIGAVLHTHSTYSVLWSFEEFENLSDIVPDHTPYLRMKLGAVGIIPYELPGSEALFSAFEKRIAASDGYILKQHGPVVPGKDILDAFYNLEELEESVKIAFYLKNKNSSN